MHLKLKQDSKSDILELNLRLLLHKYEPISANLINALRQLSVSHKIHSKSFRFQIEFLFVSRTVSLNNKLLIYTFVHQRSLLTEDTNSYFLQKTFNGAINFTDKGDCKLKTRFLAKTNNETLNVVLDETMVHTFNIFK